MVHLLMGDESEDGNRASFPRWGKRSVISNHFTELILKITEMGMLNNIYKCFLKKKIGCIIMTFLIPLI